jgi:hypothetical protein
MGGRRKLRCFLTKAQNHCAKHPLFKIKSLSLHDDMPGLGRRKHTGQIAGIILATSYLMKNNKHKITKRTNNGHN